MMSEVQEKEQKHPVTLKASVHTSPATFQWTHPVTWQGGEMYSASLRRNCKVICKGHGYRQGRLQGHVTRADAPGSHAQKGPTFG